MSAGRQAVLISGAGGFIGERLWRALQHRFDVIGLDRTPRDEPPGPAWIRADLTSDESMDRAMSRTAERSGGGLASVVHLAAYYDFSGEPSPLYEQVTVQGTRRLMEGLARHGVTPEQFVFSSTMLVHAPCRPGQQINEDWPIDPHWDYPESKVRTERLIHELRAGVPAVMLRIAGVYSDDCHSIPLANQMQRIAEKRVTSRVFPGDTSHGQSFVHVDDLVEAIVRTIDRRASLPEEIPLVIGEDEALSYDELQRTFAWLLHADPDWDTTQIPKALAKAGAWVQGVVPGVEEPFIKPWMIDMADDHYDLDIARARTLLGWEPMRRLRSTLPSMARALRDDPAGFYRTNQLKGDPGDLTLPGRPSASGTRA